MGGESGVCQYFFNPDDCGRPNYTRHLLYDPTSHYASQAEEGRTRRRLLLARFIRSVGRTIARFYVWYAKPVFVVAPKIAEGLQRVGSYFCSYFCRKRIHSLHYFHLDFFNNNLLLSVSGGCYFYCRCFHVGYFYDFYWLYHFYHYYHITY